MALDEGRSDGVWVIALLLLGSEVPALGRMAARVSVTAGWGDLLMGLATMGRVLLPPVLLLWLCEILLGAGRARARGICLVPFVAVVCLAHAWRLAGGLSGTPSWGPQLAGAVAAVALTLWIRPAVAVAATPREPEPAGEGRP